MDGLLPPWIKPLTFHKKEGPGPPLLTDVVKVTEEPWQKGFAVAKIVMVPGNGVLEAMVIGSEVTGLPLTHWSPEVNWQVTTSPFNGIKVRIELLAPANAPLTFHWYWGDDPPFEGVAVKVTCVPVHTGLPEGTIEMATGTTVCTLIVIWLETTGLTSGQVAPEVS